LEFIFNNTKLEHPERTSFYISSGDLSIRAEMNTDEFALKENKYE